MEKSEITQILKELSKGLKNNEIDRNLYAKVVESLIIGNLEIIPELEHFADFLAQYHSPKDAPELYSTNELINKINEIFGI